MPGRRVAALVAPVLVTACAAPAEVCEHPLAQLVSTEQMLADLAALQAIADDHGGNRAAGTPGYAAAVAHVVDVLDAAGHVVEREPFEFEVFELDAPAVLERIEPDPGTFEEGIDFAAGDFSGSGDAQGIVVAVDLALGPGNASTSGCEAEDFAGLGPGNIALVQRGECGFAVKAGRAEEAGAGAVVIFNQGDTAAREGLVAGTLGAGSDLGIPVVFATYAVGVELATGAQDGAELRVAVEGHRETRTDENVLAAPAAEATLLVGAHLDSVPTGPGINDNGSGTALVLALARAVATCEPGYPVRFALWGAEERGLVGSRAHVAQAGDAVTADVAAYLNFDMVASPNWVAFVYDGDGSSFDSSAATGSAALETLLRDGLGEAGIEAQDAGLDGRSDYEPFLEVGIPVGGLFTGAEGEKSAAQAGTFGGEAGAAFDGCYHAACDNLDNIATDALEANTGSAARVVERWLRDGPGMLSDSPDPRDGRGARVRPPGAGILRPGGRR
jgi:Zn-dependent M28 family amino/carboxypeptidase